MLTTQLSVQLFFPPATTTSLHHAGNNICYLKTVVATISASDTCVEANILFDEGSQRSFITKSLADCLQLQACGTEDLSISTFGTQSSHVRKLDVTTIQLHAISGQLIPLTVLIVPTIAAPNTKLKQEATHRVSTSQRVTVGSPCYLYQTIHNQLVNRSRPLLGCSRGAHHKGQWSYDNGIKVGISSLWISGRSRTKEHNS